MFSHVMVGATDIEASKAFYDATLAVLGCGPGILAPNAKGDKRYFYFSPEGGTFGISEPIDGNDASHGNGATIGFACKDTDTADKWHAAGLAAGGTAIEDAPGERAAPEGAPRMYLAYLTDPSGNKLCGLHRIQ